MKLIFKKSQGTMVTNPNGTFTSRDKVRIRKNAKQVILNEGLENEMNVWEYDEWVGTVQDYVGYTIDLLNLPSNQLEILPLIKNEQHDSVEVSFDNENNNYIINMYSNENLLEDGTYSYDILSFERPKVDDSTVEDITNEYKKYKEAMFEFCVYPEAPIKANRTSMIPMINAIIILESKYTDLLNRIEVLEGGN